MKRSWAASVKWWQNLEKIFHPQREELYRNDRLVVVVPAWRRTLELWLLLYILLTVLDFVTTLRSPGFATGFLQIHTVHTPSGVLFMGFSRLALLSSGPISLHFYRLQWHCIATSVGVLVIVRVHIISGKSFYVANESFWQTIVSETASAWVLCLCLLWVNIFSIHHVLCWAIVRVALTLHLTLNVPAQLRRVCLEVLLFGVCFLESTVLILRANDARAIWLERTKQEEGNLALRGQQSVLLAQKADLEYQASGLSSALGRESRTVVAFQSLVQSYCDAVVVLRGDQILSVQTTDPLLRSVFTQLNERRSFIATIHPSDAPHVLAALRGSGVSGLVNTRILLPNLPGAMLRGSLAVAITLMSYRDEEHGVCTLLGLDSRGEHAQSHEILPALGSDIVLDEIRGHSAKPVGPSILTDSFLLSSESSVDTSDSTHSNPEPDPPLVLLVQIYVRALTCIHTVETAAAPEKRSVFRRNSVEDAAKRQRPLVLSQGWSQPRLTLPLLASLRSSSPQGLPRLGFHTAESPASLAKSKRSSNHRSNSSPAANLSVLRSESPYGHLPDVSEVVPLQGSWRWDETTNSADTLPAPWLRHFRITHRVCTLADGGEVNLRMRQDRGIQLEGGLLSMKQGALTRTGKSGVKLCFVRDSALAFSAKSTN